MSVSTARARVVLFPYMTPSLNAPYLSPCSRSFRFDYDSFEALQRKAEPEEDDYGVDVDRPLPCPKRLACGDVWFRLHSRCRE